MGQHKYNPTAIAAKEDKLNKKAESNYSKRGFERAILNNTIKGLSYAFGLKQYDPDPYNTYRLLNPRTPSKFHK